jgi:hypothetical protein
MSGMNLNDSGQNSMEEHKYLSQYDQQLLGLFVRLLV